MDAVEIMRNTKSFAIIGASAKEESYGFKLVKTLADAGFTVFPVNPKYDNIYGLNTYKSLNDIKEPIDNVVFAMSVANNIKILNTLEIKDSFVWFPPECWDNELKAAADSKGLNYLIDLCPIGTYLKLKALSKNKETE